MSELEQLRTLNAEMVDILNDFWSLFGTTQTPLMDRTRAILDKAKPPTPTPQPAHCVNHPDRDSVDPAYNLCAECALG